MSASSLDYVTTLPLKHGGDCSLLGVTDDLTVYAEEIYGEAGWLAQHAITLDGTVVASVDEEEGAVTNAQPLTLPPDTAEPHAGWHTMTLNFSGPRHRGLYGLERTAELVRPLTVREKMALVAHFQLAIPAPSVLGLAESYVLAEAPLVRPDVFLVCRRIRLAYRLAEEQVDENNTPYDYDTFALYLAHLYDQSQDVDQTLDVLLENLPGVQLHRPMDCMIRSNMLFVADGGAGDRVSAVHVWKVTPPEPPPTDDELLHKKLYG